MLTEWTDNSLATTTRPVWDITEERPIPRGVVVALQVFDPCGGDAGLWISTAVESTWRSRMN